MSDNNGDKKVDNIPMDNKMDNKIIIVVANG